MTFPSEVDGNGRRGPRVIHATAAGKGEAGEAGPADGGRRRPASRRTPEARWRCPDRLLGQAVACRCGGTRTGRGRPWPALGLLGVLTLAPLAIAQDYGDRLPRIAPTAPSAALETFAVTDGFAVQQVAAEPLVSSPVAMQWDAAGYLYVCEMRGYSEDRAAGLSRVVRLHDDNDDGVYDTRTVFLDGLLWPTALFPYDGGLFVGDAPHIHYCKDLDGDGRADTKEIVLTGFGASNVQGLLNSFRWGLDNRIHVACGSVGGLIRRPGDDAAIDIRGRDISFDPRTHAFELASGAAQHGMGFDDWGHKFVSSNSDHIQQVMYSERDVARNPYVAAPPARVSIAADGPQAEVFRTSPVEPWRVLRTRLRVTGQAPGPIEGGGRAAGYFTGATGVTICRGDAWPKRPDPTAVVGDVGGNLVHRKSLDTAGLQYVAHRMDANREFLASRDTWFRPVQFENAPDGSLHVVDMYREVIEHPASLPPPIKRHLDLTAGRDRGRLYRIVPEGFVHRPTPRLDRATTADLVGHLDHANAWHRETAARLLFERQDRAAVAPLVELADGAATPQGRLHALCALDGLDALATAAVARRLRDPHPQVRRHAVRLCERLADLPDGLASLADDDSIEVRRQLAFTAGWLEGIGRVDILARLIRRDADNRWMRLAVQSSLVDGAGDLFARLASERTFRGPGARTFLLALAVQIARQDRPADRKVASAALPGLGVTDAVFALPLVGELGGSEDEIRRLAAIVLTQVADGGLAPSARAAAAEALAYGPAGQVTPVLLDLIGHRQATALQLAAIDTLARLDAPGLAAALVERWPQLSPRLRRTATEVLFARPSRLVVLLDALDAGTISVHEFDRSRFQAAAQSGDASVSRRAAAYAQAFGQTDRRQLVAAYLTALQTPGDAERGRTVFRKHCAACHRVDGAGVDVGPNLSAFANRGPEALVTNVLDPNREVHPQYLSYLVLTADGRTLTGMIVAESAGSVTLQRAEGVRETVRRRDVESLRGTGTSLMPVGLERSIDPAAMADLAAYLLP